MKNLQFKKTYIAASVSVLLGSLPAVEAVAQNTNSSDDLEIIEVKGIKGSLLRSADL